MAAERDKERRRSEQEQIEESDFLGRFGAKSDRCVTRWVALFPTGVPLPLLAHLWRRWAPFRRHIRRGSPTAPGTWRSSTWSWSIWGGSWRMPNCRGERQSYNWFLELLQNDWLPLKCSTFCHMTKEQTQMFCSFFFFALCNRAEQAS